jgi:hypothetical protein
MNMLMPFPIASRLCRLLLRARWLACFGALVFAMSCARKPPEEAALPVESVPAVVAEAFQQAAPQARDEAQHAVEALRGGNDASGFEDLQALTQRPDLTPDQRRATARSMLALQEKLRTAAGKGDKQAEEALERYRATK